MEILLKSEQEKNESSQDQIESYKNKIETLENETMDRNKSKDLNIEYSYDINKNIVTNNEYEK